MTPHKGEQVHIATPGIHTVPLRVWTVESDIKTIIGKPMVYLKGHSGPVHVRHLIRHHPGRWYSGCCGGVR